MVVLVGRRLAISWRGDRLATTRDNPSIFSTTRGGGLGGRGWRGSQTLAVGPAQGTQGQGLEQIAGDRTATILLAEGVRVAPIGQGGKP